MPNGTCTIGIVPPGDDVRWVSWSSKKMCGLNTDSTRALSIPPRKKVSLADTPQLLSVVTTRSCEGALRAVMMAMRRILLVAGSRFCMRSSRRCISASFWNMSASGPGWCGTAMCSVSWAWNSSRSLFA